MYILTSSFLFLFSAIYHIFNCHSNEVWQCCYKLDLTGIVFELITTTICSLHLMFHDFDYIRHAYIVVFITLGFIAVIISMFDLFISAKLNTFLMFLYASLFLISFLSSVHWAAIAKMSEVQLMSKYILSGFFFLFVGFSVFLAKFPECLIQHRYVDYFFQSHTIWHLCCVGCAVSYYLMMLNYYHLIVLKQK
jgi:adiponectin receptor